MAILIYLVLFAVLVLIVLNIAKMLRSPSDEKSIEGRSDRISHGSISPAQRAALTLREFENARAELKSRYPAVFAMLGGYLNSHTLGETGSMEAAVKEMISDWTARRDDVSRELTMILAESETEDEIRAVVLAACDAEFDQEGYRAWLTWLLGQFNALA